MNITLLKCTLIGYNVFSPICMSDGGGGNPCHCRCSVDHSVSPISLYPAI